MKHNKFISEVMEYQEEERTITMVGSTETADRVGDKVLMSGVELANFKKNPVILFNHDYDKVIGKALEVYTEGNKLIFKIQFADTDLGRETYYLIKNGYLNASSIGFIGKEYEPNGTGLTFKKVEILELSIVSVPCNPEAIVQLRKALDSKAISKGMYMELGGTEEVETEEKKETKDNTEEVIKNAIKALQSLLQAPEEKQLEEEKELEDEKEKEEEPEEEPKEEEREPEQEPDAEVRKEYTHEEIIREILKGLGGR